jgi:hypothetical protein
MMRTGSTREGAGDPPVTAALRDGMPISVEFSTLPFCRREPSTSRIASRAGLAQLAPLRPVAAAAALRCRPTVPSDGAVRR